ncbi:PIG-L family deacetylase [Alphaproteobacteria bacterium]|nr:PIG-L family deacetylase [Alphaproteobacteria bacterium]MDC1023109.1 PIG-L family deacetylase [Alphaproteobacteria bacterium]
MIDFPKKIVIIAPHPDDEVLGVGGTISRFAKNGVEVSILVVSGHLPPIYDEKSFLITQKEALNAFKVMHVKNWKFLKIPATTLHQIPVAELNKKISNFIEKHKPDCVFLPFPDRHIDHRTVFDASVVACRPNNKNAPRIVLAYETLSETHWNVPGIEPSFNPDFFVNISDFIDDKKEALKQYTSQIDGQNSRSIEACFALSKFRGSQNYCDYAEAFKVVRIVV